jgi:TRAP-type C4-dicarboxylate transport system permease small subunit
MPGRAGPGWETCEGRPQAGGTMVFPASPRDFPVISKLPTATFLEHAIMDAIGTSLRLIQRFIGWLSQLMGLLAMVAIVAITVAMLSEVFLRYVFGRSMLGVVEFVEIMMSFIFFALMSYTQFLKGHLRLSLFTDYLPSRPKMMLEVVVLFIVSIFLMLMTWQAVSEAIIATERQQIRFGAIEYPLWPAKIAAAFAMCVVVLQIVADFFDRLVETVRGETPTTELGRPASEADSV